MLKIVIDWNSKYPKKRKAKNTQAKLKLWLRQAAAGYQMAKIGQHNSVTFDKLLGPKRWLSPRIAAQ